MHDGMIVDANIIHAPSSAKNVIKSRDSEMRSVKKGDYCFFWMKIHSGVDVARGYAIRSRRSPPTCTTSPRYMNFHRISSRRRIQERIETGISSAESFGSSQKGEVSSHREVSAPCG